MDEIATLIKENPIILKRSQDLFNGIINVKRDYIKEFSIKVAAYVSNKLGSDWVLENTIQNDPFKIYGYIHIYKESWGQAVRICLQSQSKYSSGYIVGIAGLSGKLEGIVGKMDCIHSDGIKKSDAWAWYHDLHITPGFHWHKSDMVLKMTENNSVEDLGDYLCKIANCAAPIIEKSIAQLNRSNK